MLGITRQRVHQLWRDRKDFPEPVYELRTGPLWMRAGIKAFADRWERKPGRPDHGVRNGGERVTSALLDAGLTVADARVFLGHERTVILQIDSPGPLQSRRKVAARVIQALNSAGLGVTDGASDFCRGHGVVPCGRPHGRDLRSHRARYRCWLIPRRTDDCGSGSAQWLARGWAFDFTRLTLWPHPGQSRRAVVECSVFYNGPDFSASRSATKASLTAKALIVKTSGE